MDAIQQTFFKKNHEVLFFQYKCKCKAELEKVQLR
jgi:hypothetical protein